MLKLGLIGCGKMGGALLRGVEQALGKGSLHVALSDVMPEAMNSLRKCLTCKCITGTPAEVAASSDVIILAVKPGDMQALCAALAEPLSRAALPLFRHRTAASTVTLGRAS